MTADSAFDCSWLDQPEVLSYLFYPRRSFPLPPSEGVYDLIISVADGVTVGARVHLAAADAINILFFHGNGETVHDYDDIGALYVARSLNFLAVDYRGYGQSTGWPTASALLADSHAILDYLAHWLSQEGLTGPLLVMGRSLGSVPALELAWRRSERVAGLILESAFAHTGPLLRRIGVDPATLATFAETQGFRQLEKMQTVVKPTLIIHAEQDQLIPLGDGQALYAASPALDKQLLKIPRADHNTIFMVDLPSYLEAIQIFADPSRFDPHL